MKLPDPPAAGDPFRASWARQVIDYLRSITPRSGMDIHPEIKANGTILRIAIKPGRPGSSSAFTVEGDEVLYACIMLREYDEDGVLVAIGSESDPLAEGHTLKPTWQALAEITVVTDVQYDVSTHQLQKKTRTILVPIAEAESNWTMITGGQYSTGCT
jgi:hypothetical protein